MAETVLRSASFSPKVKAYWLINLLIVSGLTIIGIPLLLISVPLMLFISSRMLKAMSAELTERKLVVKRGVFFKVEKSIPLEKITDVAMSQGPLMRAMGLYSLSFETAGQSGQGPGNNWRNTGAPEVRDCAWKRDAHPPYPRRTAQILVESVK